MSILITASPQGTLKITNSSASPQSNYLTNLQTVGVIGNAQSLTVAITNSEGANLAEWKLSDIAGVGASGSFTGANGLQNAVSAINSLIVK